MDRWTDGGMDAWVHVTVIIVIRISITISMNSSSSVGFGARSLRMEDATSTTSWPGGDHVLYGGVRCSLFSLRGIPPAQICLVVCCDAVLLRLLMG